MLLLSRMTGAMMISAMNIRDFDLNLLLALDALLQEKHVTRAAARVGLSQPAMSNALGRLRELLDDPLLVRTAGGMLPTPRAERLQQPVREALQAVERAVNDDDAFTPGTCQEGFDLLTSDAIGMLLLPALSARLRAEARNMDLRVHAPEADDPWSGLDSARVDLVVGVYDAAPADIHEQALYDERYVCLMRDDHPSARNVLTLQRYVELPHIRIATTRAGLGVSVVDHALTQRGLTRRIALTLPHFLVAPYVVAQSDHVITFPSRLADYFATFLPLRVVEPPLGLSNYTISLYWHERLERDPASRWLREQIVAVSRRIGVPEGLGAVGGLVMPPDGAGSGPVH